MLVDLLSMNPVLLQKKSVGGSNLAIGKISYT